MENEKVQNENENEQTKVFIASLSDTNKLLSEKDKKRYEQTNLSASYELDDLTPIIANVNIIKFSYDKLEKICKPTFKRSFVEKKFCDSLKLEFDVLHNAIRKQDLFRAYNYVLSEWLNANKSLLLI